MKNFALCLLFLDAAYRRTSSIILGPLDIVCHSLHQLGFICTYIISASHSHKINMSGPPPGPYLYSQLFFTPPKPTQKYTNQVILVTGSNSGLGLEAARWFVKLDAAKVIIAVRSQSKGEEAKRSIEASTKRLGVVEVWSLDLSSYDSVKECAKKAESLERLDVLVENAGVVTYKWNMMEDDEATITTNVVSPLFHAILSLPKLRETSMKFNTTTKIVFTSSFTHWMTKFEEQKEDRIFEALADEKKANMADRYGLSALGAHVLIPC